MSYEYGPLYSIEMPLEVAWLYFLVIGLLLLANSITFYRFACASDYDNIAFLAFIPILCWILRFKMGGMSGWNILWLFIPFVNIIGFIILYVGIYRSYKRNSNGNAGDYLILNLFLLEFLANIFARRKSKKLVHKWTNSKK